MRYELADIVKKDLRLHTKPNPKTLNNSNDTYDVIMMLIHAAQSNKAYDDMSHVLIFPNYKDLMIHI